MEFKVGDLVTVNEMNNKYYYGNEIGPIFVLSKVIANSIYNYGYRLGDQNKTTIIMITDAYRKATEPEIKKYKMKNLFVRKGKNYDI